MQIKFFARNKTVFQLQKKPIPAKNYMPEWIKKMSLYYPENKLKISSSTSNMTVKKCPPYLDVLQAGYYVQLHTDVFITQHDNNYHIDWKVKDSPFEIHGEQSKLIETPHGYHEHVVKYLWGVIPKVPKGYSLLVIHPQAYQNLPFKTVPAIVDCDTLTFNFTLPVWVSKNHEGIIKKGTPIAQLIPIKRDTWNSSYESFKNDEYDILQQKDYAATLIDRYRNKYWHKKSYN